MGMSVSVPFLLPDVEVMVGNSEFSFYNLHIIEIVGVKLLGCAS